MSGNVLVKTFDRYTDDAAPATGTPAARGVWALRITKFDVGAKIGVDPGALRTVRALTHYRRRPTRGAEAFDVYVSGNIAFEYVTDQGEYDIFDGSLSPNNSIDTGGNVIAVGPDAAGAAPTANPVQMAGYDQGSNAVRRLICDVAGKLSVGMDTTGTAGALGALNATVQVALAGCQSASFTIAAGLVGTIVPEVSFDGGTSWDTSTWGTVFVTVSQAVASIVNPLAQRAQIAIPGGATHLRVRVSAYTSGSANATLRAVFAPPTYTAGLTPYPPLQLLGGLDSTPIVYPLRLAPSGTGAASSDPALVVAQRDNGCTQNFSGTAPSAPGTVLGSTFVGNGVYRRAQCDCLVQGSTGGTLDIYLQTSFDFGTKWIDVAHLAQLAAAAAQRRDAIVLDPTSGVPAVPLAGLNVADGTPTLAVNSQRNLVGNAWRIVYVAGAGTSAGAAQTIKGIFN